MSKGRPGGPLPDFADTKTFSGFTGDEAVFNGAATKTFPSNTAQGWKPNRRQPAKWRNWLDNRILAMLRHLDMIEVQNWIEPGPTNGVVATISAGTIALFAEVPIDTQRRILAACLGDTDIQASIDGGYTWASIYNLGTAEFRDLCATALCGAAVLSDGGTSKILHFRPGTSAFALTTVGDFTEARCIAPDDYDAFVWVGGEDSGDRRVIKVPYTLTGFGTPVDMGVFGTGSIRFIAVGPDTAICSDGSDIFVSADKEDAFEEPGVNLGDDVIGLLYLPNEESFLAITNNTTDGAVWTSQDGVNWSLINTNPWTFTGASNSLTRAQVHGSTILTPVEIGGEMWIAISVNAGADWTVIPDPTLRHGFGAQTAFIRRIVNRWILANYVGGGDTYHYMSLRTSIENES